VALEIILRKDLPAEATTIAVITRAMEEIQEVIIRAMEEVQEVIIRVMEEVQEGTIRATEEVQEGTIRAMEEVQEVITRVMEEVQEEMEVLRRRKISKRESHPMATRRREERAISTTKNHESLQTHLMQVTILLGTRKRTIRRNLDRSRECLKELRRPLNKQFICISFITIVHFLV